MKMRVMAPMMTRPATASPITMDAQTGKLGPGVVDDVVDETPLHGTVFHVFLNTYARRRTSLNNASRRFKHSC